MKKVNSLLALLLLGGMVLAGCGDKDKDTIPGDSGTPTQQPGNNNPATGNGGNGNNNNNGNGNNGNGNASISVSWPATTVQVYLDTLGVQHDIVPAIENDAITSYVISPDMTTAQTEQAFSISCMGGGNLLNSYVDVLTANGYSYQENAGCYSTPLGEICIGLDVLEGNLVIIVMLPDAGGEGGGQQQINRFVGRKLVISDVKDQNGQALDNLTRQYILAKYGNNWISLFDNFKFEMVQPLASSFDVIKGEYEVANNDTTCVLTPIKMFDGTHQVYSYEIPTELASLTIQYTLNTQEYSVMLAVETSTDVYTYFKLILEVDVSDLEPVDIIDDPNGENFDPRYQVTEAQWNEYFNTDGAILSKNFTVTQPVKMNNVLVSTHVWEIDESRIHYSFVSENDNYEAYYQVKTPIRDEYNVLQGFNTITYTSDGNGGWHVANNGSIDYLLFIHDTGLFNFTLSSFSYSNFESTRYYCKSSLTLPCDYDHPHNMTDVKIWFNNGKLMRIEYTEMGAKYEFVFSKHGTTEVDLSQVGGPQMAPASYPSLALANFFSNEHITDPLPEMYFNATYEGSSDAGIFQMSITPDIGTTIGEILDGLDEIFENPANKFYKDGDDHYNSEHGDFYVDFSSQSTFVLVVVVAPGITTIYPAAKISNFLYGINYSNHFDTLPYLDATYSWVWPSNTIEYSQLNVFVDGYDSSDYFDLADDLKSDLEDDGFIFAYAESADENVYVCQGTNYGINIVFGSSYVTVEFYNFIINPDSFYVEYEFVLTDSTNVFNDSPKFYAYIFGGSLGLGEWFEVDQSGSSPYFYVAEVPLDAEGVVLVRTDATYQAISQAEDPFDLVWNQTSDIQLTFGILSYEFVFNM